MRFFLLTERVDRSRSFVTSHACCKDGRPNTVDTDCSMRRPTECSRMDHSFRASSCPTLRCTWITQDALLDMTDAICSTDMHARPGDAELIPGSLFWIVHHSTLRREVRSIMRDTRQHIKLCYVKRNFTEVHTADWTERTCELSKNSSQSEVRKHFAEFFLEDESNFEHVDLDSSTSGAPTARCSSHQRAHSSTERLTACNIELLAGASSIATRLQAIRELLAEQKMPSGDGRTVSHERTAERASRAQIAEARSVGATGRRSQQLGVTPLVRACMSVSIASISTAMLVQKELSFVACFQRVHPFLPVVCTCVFTFFASSIACTQNGVK